jgi:hypothetical protein
LTDESIAVAPLLDRPEDESLDKARTEAGFSVGVPSSLPDGVSLDKVQVTRKLGAGSLDVTVFLHFRDPTPGANARDFAITERKVQTFAPLPGEPSTTPGVVGGAPVSVLGVSAAWVPGVVNQNNWLEWNKEGVNYVIQGAANVGLGEQDYVDIANSIQAS